MRNGRPIIKKNRAFTLVEVLVATAVASLILAAIATGAIACQKVFAAADGGLKASADQLRIMDYIDRDVRQALTVVVSNSGQTLTLTVPSYLDSTTGLPVIPTIVPSKDTNGTPNGTVDYGTAATITYFPSNGPAPYSYDANGRYLIRQVGVVQTAISRDCTNLQISFTDQTTSVLTSITYQPHYTFNSLADPRSTTTECATPLLRNKRRN
jgi:prepilin-type N-terminal cleavage/methylation domain-containing protein